MDVFLVPFSLLWGGFAISWNADVWTANTPLEFRLFGLPFLIAGVYVTVGRFVLDAWIRSRLRYVLTDRRVLIVREGPFRSVRSLDLKHLPELELIERHDGSGTILFGDADSSWWSRGRGGDIGFWSPALRRSPQFIRIPAVRRVYEMIDRQAYPA
jgi:hypothetical protein